MQPHGDCVHCNNMYKLCRLLCVYKVKVAESLLLGLCVYGMYNHTLYSVVPLNVHMYTYVYTYMYGHAALSGAARDGAVTCHAMCRCDAAVPQRASA